MKTISHLLIIFCGVIVLSTHSGPAQARFKCWKNHEGIRECGEKIPPEFAQQGHQEMSKHGIMLEEKERAKTKEELAEAARLAEIAKAQQKIKDEQDKKDKILLDTFTSVADIETVRDDKVAVIESSINLTNKRNEKTQEDLDKRINAAATAERAGNAPNEALLNDIKVLRGRIENNEVFIQQRIKDQKAAKSAAELDINRYKKLKGL